MRYIKSPSLLMSLTALAVSATLTGCDLDFKNDRSEPSSSDSIIREAFTTDSLTADFSTVAGGDDAVSFAELSTYYFVSQATFSAIDADSSGAITQAELAAYIEAQNPVTEGPEQGTVRVKVPEGWGAPNVYLWNDNGTLEGWPGVAMTAVSDGIYEFVIPADYQVGNIIFNDGAVQTTDMQHDSATGLYGIATVGAGNGCFVVDGVLAEGQTNYSGQWTNEYSCTAMNKVLFQKPEDWAEVRIHMFSAAPTDVVADTTWPGLEMTEEGNGIYSYTFPDDLTSVGIVFNNNNNGLQTSDVTFDATLALNGTPAASIGAGCYNGDTRLWTNFANCVSSPSLMDGFAAHWIDANTIAWNFADGDMATLYYSADGALAEAENDQGVKVIEGGQSVALTKGDVLTAEQQAKWPHLAGYTTYTLADDADTAALAKSQLAIVASLEDGTPLKGTQLQTAGALDALYGYEGDLGVIFTDSQIDFKLWAPTAQNVKLHVYDPAKAEVTGSPFAMTSADGVWSYNTAEAWKGNFYRYEVTVYRWDTQTVETVMVTDPYSVSLSEGSDYSQIVDLNDTSLKPTGWDSYEKPALEAPEDIVIYETHVRDFSILDQTVPAEHRGKFLAYLDQDSDPVKHLLALKEAGLTHVQLLPAFDIATINETANQRVEITDMVDDLCAIQSIDNFCDTYAGKTIKTAFEEIVAATNGDTTLIQQVYSVLRGLDGFNWGYDPYHYTVPEGSYATNAEGSQRILEYRELVKGLNEMGLRVVMDVVYNHTNSAGLADESVLDKIVPGYYQRRDQATGQIANSTCCSNTASEHMMMEKLMVDSLVTWAKQYKVDSFRFDLMGHHMKVNMEKVRDTLQALTLAEDGVDGSKIYLYGEGWNFGEVENGARGENAIQQSMAGTGIGTFSDRLRDMVRGGSPFDSQDTIRSAQGFANGLYYDPNELNSGSEDELVALMGATDMIRVGMAGNLKDYTITDLNGETVRGDEIPYGSSQMAGYTDDPQEVINYVSKHDNQTLFDNNAYKTPAGTDMATRVRIHNVAMDTVLLAQGIPFIHMGSDLMRSKSMQRNSYDSGDWFNWVDFSMNSNNWNMGLPRESEDGANWDLIRSIIADTSINPQQADIEAAATHFQEMLKIRSSSKLFRLRTKEQVLNQVHFMNTGAGQKAGLIAMHIAGNCELDTVNGQIMALINANDEAQTFTVAGASGYTLHPVQQNSVDAVVKTATFADGTFSVPARTSAVFVTAASCAK